MYVGYRLAVSGTIVWYLNKIVPYYWAVFFMAQLSFLYDSVIFAVYFSADGFPSLANYAVSNLAYTARVVAAWWYIKQLWNWSGRYWLAVFVGAQTTFAIDYFIFWRLFA